MGSCVAYHILCEMEHDKIRWGIHSLCRKWYQKIGSPLKDYYTTVKEYVADVNASIPKEDKEKIAFTIHSGKLLLH